jgi:hypothetical protein
MRLAELSSNGYIPLPLPLPYHKETNEIWFIRKKVEKMKIAFKDRCNIQLFVIPTDSRQAGIDMSYWLTKENENMFPLWKRGMKGDFKINGSIIKSPLTPLCQRGVFSGQ